MKKELEQIFEALSDSFQQESNMKHVEWIQNIKNEYHYLDIEKPEKFSLLISITLEDQANTLIRTILSHINIEYNKKYKLEFTYLQYDFIVHHLKSVILEFEGSDCSTDKTRWLIDTYSEYLISDTLPIINKTNYWHPSCGETIDWMIWIDSMYEFYYGKIEEYLLSKENIVNFYKNKN
jgi:hypothetical protein